MRRLSIALIILLVFAISSCNLSDDNSVSPEDTPASLLKLEVSASTEDTTSILYVTYRPGAKPDTLTCNFTPSTSGGAGTVGTITEEIPADPTGKFEQTRGTYYFNATAGDYSMGCSMKRWQLFHEDSGGMATDFSVAKAADAATPETGAYPPGAFKTADLDLWQEEVTSSQPDAVKTIDGCWPFHSSNNLPGATASFTVSPTGELSGSCSWTDGSTTLSGTLTGKMEGSSITFTLTTQHIFTYTNKANPPETATSIVNMILEGSGAFISDQVAQGTATWSGACDVDNPNVMVCNGPSDTWKASGIVPWSMEFKP